MNSVELLKQEREEDRVRLTLYIPATLCYFPDHFAHFPLLPGVVQIDLVACYAKQYFDLKGSCKRLEQVKFQAMIRPEHTVLLQLHFEREKQRVSFTIDGPNGRNAAGRLVFSEG